MPGAEHDLDLVPLEADGAGFTMLGRFPVGFRRMAHGGYFAAEDVIVLDGHLDLEGRIYRRGTLLHIPARYPRTSMHTPDGCLVIAWFSGSAVFRPPDDLQPPPLGELRSVGLVSAGDRDLLTTEVSHWVAVSVDSLPPEADAVDLNLTMWARASADWPGMAPKRVLARVPCGAKSRPE